MELGKDKSDFYLSAINDCLGEIIPSFSNNPHEDLWKPICDEGIEMLNYWLVSFFTV